MNKSLFATTAVCLCASFAGTTNTAGADDAAELIFPAVIQGSDGRIHAVYSCFVAGGKSMKRN